jgi:hypothetical protein
MGQERSSDKPHSAGSDGSGYLGDSTRREIAHARAAGKPIRYLETPSKEEASE